MTNFHNNNAQIAIIGNGKTGHAVVENIPQQNIFAIFDAHNPVTAERLSGADIAIVFVNHIALETILPELIAARIPVICGTTGFNWTNEIQQAITNTGQTWVVAHNFSLSMHLIRNCLQILGTAENLIDNVSFNIHEVHHVQKIDAPSGTAISWDNWLNTSNTNITYDRVEDVAGIHTLTIQTPNEEITLTHKALNRGLFAEGAIWAANQALSQNELPTGLLHFSQLIEHTLNQTQTQEECQHA
jgi:4-hydroxy-tetrahydrodipicolinate reductase